MPTLEALTSEAFKTLVEEAQVIEKDSYGPKVYRLKNGDYLKLFRRKRLISSATLWPYSKRFWNNAQRLKQYGIPTIEPLHLYRLSTPGWTAVHYRALAGDTLSQLYKQDPHNIEKLLNPLIELVRLLHQKGIYFRSLHLGNIVVTPDGQLGLIDIADLDIQSRPISRHKAMRNLAHFERYLKYNGINDFPFSALSQGVLAR